MASLGYALGKYDYDASPSSNSKTQDVQASVGYGNSNNYEDASLPFIWSWNISLTGTLQNQKLETGEKTKNTMYGMTFSGQRDSWGRVNMIFSTGIIVQPTAGASNLRTNSGEIEAIHDFSAHDAVKVYLRKVRRNIHDVTLESKEQTIGAQYVKTF